jgi:hypothetical protein
MRHLGVLVRSGDKAEHQVRNLGVLGGGHDGRLFAGFRRDHVSSGTPSNQEDRSAIAIGLPGSRGASTLDRTRVELIAIGAHRRRITTVAVLLESLGYGLTEGVIPSSAGRSVFVSAEYCDRGRSDAPTHTDRICLPHRVIKRLQWQVLRAHRCGHTAPPLDRLRAGIGDKRGAAGPLPGLDPEPSKVVIDDRA